MIPATSKGNIPLLSCENLSVGYKNSTILTDVNLTFGNSQFISLLGPNGAGKTTLLRTLSRHLPPIAGAIQLGDRDLASLRQSELARVMAVVLTDKVTPPLFTAFQFVALGRYPHTGFLGRLNTRDEEVVHNSLTAVNAGNLVDREFTSLSDGERQKVLVARALAQEPQILLLDEPTAHLDLKHRVEVMSILRNLCATQGITVIASLHDVDIAAKVSDMVALVKDGGITGWGSPEEILGDREVAELYDFDSASFNRQLGSIELRGKEDREKVFVVGGMGRGAAVFRLLTKKGYRIRTGVLFQNDLDFFVAESLRIPCASQQPAAEISNNSLKQAIDEMEECDWVVDAGFSSCSSYRNNIQLLEKAADLGKTVLRVGKREPDSLNNHFSAQIINLENISELSVAMEKN